MVQVASLIQIGAKHQIALYFCTYVVVLGNQVFHRLFGETEGHHLPVVVLSPLMMVHRSRLFTSLALGATSPHLLLRSFQRGRNVRKGRLRKPLRQLRRLQLVPQPTLNHGLPGSVSRTHHAMILLLIL